MKKLLTSDMLVHFFDPKLTTELFTDASKLKGLGFAIIQREEDGKIRCIQCGSKTLSSAEKGYAPIALESLALPWAMQKC